MLAVEYWRFIQSPNCFLQAAVCKSLTLVEIFSKVDINGHEVSFKVRNHPFRPVKFPPKFPPKPVLNQK